MTNREDECTVVKYKNTYEGVTQSTHNIDHSSLTRIYGGHADKF